MTERTFTKIIPAKGHLVVERLQGESATKGGILLPDQSVQRPNMGTVHSGGIENHSGGFDRLYAVGDVVLFASFAGVEVEIDGRELLILKVEDVLATVG